VLALLDEGTGPAAVLDDPRRPLPDLVASDLTCAWPDGPAVVEGLDLTVRPGRSVAIVGPSGAGKTTTLLTLAGLLPARSGTLRLDHEDMSDYGREAVTATVLVGTEDAHVFGTTVLENLRVARGDVTRDEATAALERVALGEWLTRLPDGLDTVLGPDARTVSGGERRRLLVARALLSPAPLVLLDEPAEHLDPVTADALVTDLLRDARGIAVVTHRLSPLHAADEVLWLDDGRVRARGTHAELLRTVPAYRAALELESAGGAAART
jgi:ATP-binding cassette subfamily C protein CydC